MKHRMNLMSMKNTKLCGMAALLVAALSAVCLGQDNPVVSKLFSDHMVLQREMPVPVWGMAKPGTKVTVKFGAQQEKTGEAGTDGKWLLRLDALKVSAEPAALTVKFVAGDKPVIMSIADVLVGYGQLFAELTQPLIPFALKGRKVEGNKIRISFDYVGKGLRK